MDNVFFHALSSDLLPILIENTPIFPTFSSGCRGDNYVHHKTQKELDYFEIVEIIRSYHVTEGRITLF